MIQRTPRGRMLSAGAYEHLGLQAPKEIALMQMDLLEAGLDSSANQVDEEHNG